MGRLTTIGVLVILGSVLSVAVLRYFDPLHRSRVPILLDPRRTRKHPLKVKLVEKKPLNSDCYIFTFELPKSSDGNDQQQRPVALGCDPGNHVRLFIEVIEGKFISRPYSPISTKYEENYVRFLIRVYPNGILTQFLETAPLNTFYDLSGPFGNITYIGNSEFQFLNKKQKFTDLLFIAGGTGITPIYAVIIDILTRKDDVNITLLFANRCADQILLREELDELDKEHSNFKLHHTIDAILDEMGWRHFIGHINAQMIKKVMPTQILRNETTATMVCGPPPMVKFLREELSGLEAQNVHKF